MVRTSFRPFCFGPYGPAQVQRPKPDDRLNKIGGPNVSTAESVNAVNAK